MIRFSIHYFMLFAMYATVFPYFQLLLKSRGFSMREVGFLQGLVVLAGVGGPLAVGYLADQLGRRRTFLVAGCIAFALMMVPMAAVTRVVVAAVLAVGIGLTSRVAIPLTDALASHELPDPARTYGRVRVWGSLGFVLTVLALSLGGLVDESSSMSMVRAVLVAAGLCAITSSLLPDHHRRSRLAGPAPAGQGSFGGAFWLFILIAAWHPLAMAAYYQFFSLYLKEMYGLKKAVWIWSMGSAAEIPLLLFSAAIIRRIGVSAALTLALSAVSVRLLVLAQVPPLPVVLASQLLHALTFGLFHATSIEFLRRCAPPARRGLAMAIYAGVALALPGWIGSSLGGLAIQRWGYPTAYLAYAAAPVVGLVVLAAVGGRLEAAGGDEKQQKRIVNVE